MDSQFVSNMLDDIDRALDNVMAIASLDEITLLLKQMLALASRAAEDSCTDGERVQLQREFNILRDKIDKVADSIKLEQSAFQE